MSVTAKKWMSLVAIALLVSVIAVVAGCSSPAGSSSASSSASSEAASSEAASSEAASSEASLSAQVGMVNPWSDAASAEEAAKGAGLEAFPLPEGEIGTREDAIAKAAELAGVSNYATTTLAFSDYDTIFLGYPNWWGTCPMCVFTFLEHYDLAGKRIVPFCTNEGSGMGGSEKHLEKICPGASIEKGLSITGNQAAQSRDRAQAWARKFA